MSSLSEGVDKVAKRKASTQNEKDTIKSTDISSKKRRTPECQYHTSSAVPSQSLDNPSTRGNVPKTTQTSGDLAPGSRAEVKNESRLDSEHKYQSKNESTLRQSTQKNNPRTRSPKASQKIVSATNVIDLTNPEPQSPHNIKANPTQQDSTDGELTAPTNISPIEAVLNSIKTRLAEVDSEINGIDTSRRPPSIQDRLREDGKRAANTEFPTIKNVLTLNAADLNAGRPIGGDSKLPNSRALMKVAARLPRDHDDASEGIVSLALTQFNEWQTQADVKHLYRKKEMLVLVRKIFEESGDTE